MPIANVTTVQELIEPLNENFDAIDAALDALVGGGGGGGGTTAIADGGTGATTAAGARTNLGLGSVATENTVPVSKGGTNSTTAADARSTLGLGTVAVENTVPVAKGGSGSTTVTAASSALGYRYNPASLAAFKALTDRPAIFYDGSAWDWFAGSSTTADDVLIINPTSGAAGRYKRNFNGIVSPQWYGCIGNGSTDDKANMITACQSGYMVDGGGLNYGISGQMRPTTNFKGLRNCTLTQLAPTTSSCRTLFLDDLSNWTVQNVKIDCGGDQDAGNITDWAGVWISGTTTKNWRLIDVEVFNGGPINGIAVLDATKGHIINPVVRDFVYNLSPDPTDDVIQGIWLVRAVDVKIVAPRIQDLTGFLLGVSSLRFSRGISMGTSTRVSVMSPTILNVDQGIDLSGSGSNTECHVSDVSMGATGTYGMKFSNASQQCSIVGGTITSAGLAGVVVSGQASASPVAIDTLISDLLIKNTGSSGLWAANGPTGVQIYASTNDNTYPRGVRVRNVGVIDTAGSPTTVYGFRSDATPIDNYIDPTCWSRNCTNFQSGFVVRTPGYLAFTARGVNFNSANSDTLIPIVMPQPYTEYVPLRISIANASQTLTTATCSVWTAAGGTGTAIVASATAITVSTGADNTNNNSQTLIIINSNTNAWKLPAFYFRVQTAQGAAATGDVTVTLEPRS